VVHLKTAKALGLIIPQSVSVPRSSNERRLMDRRAFVTLVGEGVLSAPFFGQAQQPGRNSDAQRVPMLQRGLNLSHWFAHARAALRDRHLALLRPCPRRLSALSERDFHFRVSHLMDFCLNAASHQLFATRPAWGNPG
jgi:hypothetical protein